MLPLAIDENFNNDIVRGLLRRRPELDLVRIQDAGLAGADDPTVLDWAAQESRVLLTHDVSSSDRSSEKVLIIRPEWSSNRTGHPLTLQNKQKAKL